MGLLALGVACVARLWSQDPSGWEDEEPSMPDADFGTFRVLDGSVFTEEYPAVAAALSPDGARLLVLDARGFLDAWDRGTGRRVFRRQAIDPGHRRRRLAVSPGGQWVSLADLAHQTVTVFHARTGDEALRLDHCSGAVFSSSDTVLTGWSGSKVRSWEVATARERVPFVPSPGRILALDVSSDSGLVVATVDGSSDLWLWDGGTGMLSTRLKPPPDLPFQATGVALSPKGTLLAVGNPWYVQLWSRTNGRWEPFRKLEIWGGPPLRFCRDDRRLVGTSFLRRVEVQDLDASDPVATFFSPPGVYGFHEISPDGREVISARGIWVRVHVLASDPGGDPPSPPVTAIGFTKKGEILLGTKAGEIRAWENRGFRPHRTLVQGGPPIRGFAPDGSLAVVDSDSPSLGILDLVQGHAHPPIETPHRTSSMAWSPDGTRLALSTSDKTLSILDLGDLKERLRIPTGTFGVRAIAWSRSGAWIAWGEASGGVAIASTTRGNETTRFASRGGAITTLAFLPEGHALVSGNNKGEVRHWDEDPTLSSRLLGQMGGEVRALSVSADGREVATGDVTGEIVLWSVDGKTPPRQLGRHSDAITALAFTPGGDQLVSAGTGGPARIWELRLK